MNIGLLEDEHLQPGDWVLIHVGFAMSKIDEDEARRALEGLQLLGRELDDELEALATSRITADELGGRTMMATIRVVWFPEERDLRVA